MNRYLSSFALSIAIYVTLVATIFYSINSNKHEAKSKMESTKVVKISLLDLHQESQKQEEKKQVEPKKELQAPAPKQEPKKEPVAKAEPKKILKKVSPPLIKDTKSIEKVAYKEETQQEREKENLLQEETAAKQILSNAAVISQENDVREKQRIMAELQVKQESFFLKLRELINQNKFYPNSARRRGVQGNVEVKFCILENGNVENIELISGQTIFKNSVQEAIEKSFPVKVDKTLFSFPKEFKITLAYVLADATN
ncbi:energy transducer TonB [bacterium]|nr:energy transducer TonB [bacterium]MBU1433801.1 energy transducer TonB [bacterium]MBU1503876.1 energy transducer TonB [bacterium]